MCTIHNKHIYMMLVAISWEANIVNVKFEHRSLSSFFGREERSWKNQSPFCFVTMKQIKVEKREFWRSIQVGYSLPSAGLLTVLYVSALFQSIGRETNFNFNRQQFTLPVEISLSKISFNFFLLKYNSNPFGELIKRLVVLRLKWKMRFLIVSTL